jgi:hypothetical protein
LIGRKQNENIRLRCFPQTGGVARTALRSSSSSDLPFLGTSAELQPAGTTEAGYPGANQSFHWGYKDPAGVPGDEAAKLAAYDRVFRDLAERVRQFVVIAERQRRVTLGG